MVNTSQIILESCEWQRAQQSSIYTSPAGHISLLVPRPPMPLSSDYHKKQFIVNEVLCYIQNKMDTKAKEVIVNLASQFFTYEEIIAAKKLLYEVVPVTCRRLIIHRGDDKARQEVADMY